MDDKNDKIIETMEKESLNALRLIIRLQKAGKD